MIHSFVSPSLAHTWLMLSSHFFCPRVLRESGCDSRVSFIILLVRFREQVNRKLYISY